MLLDVFHEGYKHRSCLGVDPRDKPFLLLLRQERSLNLIYSKTLLARLSILLISSKRVFFNQRVGLVGRSGLDNRD